MIYIDTSSLLKLVLTDEHSAAVDHAVHSEKAVIVSPLAELEACVQIHGLHLGGKLSQPQSMRILDRLTQILESDPFQKRNPSSSMFKTALEQHRISIIHCRSLDRLHLAGMAELGIKRLMTHDFRQASAARELGYEVLFPGS